jgi:hypothetical protein
VTAGIEHHDAQRLESHPARLRQRGVDDHRSLIERQHGLI